MCTDDKKQISKAPGVGPKTAARIILELKDKLRADAETASDVADTDAPAISGIGSKSAEAIDALTVLGFNRAAALDALRGIDIDNTELEDIIRAALKKLMK